MTWTTTTGQIERLLLAFFQPGEDLQTPLYSSKPSRMLRAFSSQATPTDGEYHVCVQLLLPTDGNAWAETYVSAIRIQILEMLMFSYKFNLVKIFIVG